MGVHKFYPVLDEEGEAGLQSGWCGRLEGLSMEFDVRPSVRKGDKPSTKSEARLRKGQQVWCFTSIEGFALGGSMMDFHLGCSNQHNMFFLFWQWLSVTMSTKLGGVFGTTKDLGSAKIPIQAIAAAVLFPQSKDSPEVFQSYFDFDLNLNEKPSFSN